MKELLIVANWKMNKNILETKKFLKEFLPQVEECKNNMVAIAPSFTLLETVSKKLKNTKVKLASQNLSYENEGAFTGEVNAKMLKDFDVEYVILGHSERRQKFFETDEIINKKVLQAVKNNFVPILCVGETQEEYDKNLSEQVVERQILSALKNVDFSKNGELVIAYEPVWAIGTGRAATAENSNKMSKFIRKTVKNAVKTVKNLKILYGGSVNVNNFKEFFKESDIDGALIGGASLDANSFAKIVLG
ncbi:MAG: triose-phosphate isomerase [Spirochaetales bacterium]